MVALAKSKQNSNASVNKWKWCVCASSSSSNQASSMQIRDSASRLIELRLLLAKSYKNNDGFGDGVVVVVNQPVSQIFSLFAFFCQSAQRRESETSTHVDTTAAPKKADGGCRVPVCRVSEHLQNFCLIAD